MGALYTSDSYFGALMETVFHDVDMMVPTPHVFLSDFRRHRRSYLVTLKEIRVARADDAALKRLGVDRAELIDTPPSSYSETVLWAQAAREAPLDGIVWNSRRYPHSLCFNFFGDRVDRMSALDVQKPPRPLLDPESYEDLMAMATDHGITVIH